jgi:hypothetical protein
MTGLGGGFSSLCTTGPFAAATDTGVSFSASFQSAIF